MPLIRGRTYRLLAHSPLMGVPATWALPPNISKKTGKISPLPLERSSHSGVAALHPPLMGVPATWASPPNISKKQGPFYITPTFPPLGHCRTFQPLRASPFYITPTFPPLGHRRVRSSPLGASPHTYAITLSYSLNRIVKKIWLTIILLN
jgi:hypothetical protein